MARTWPVGSGFFSAFLISVKSAIVKLYGSLVIIALKAFSNFGFWPGGWCGIWLDTSSKWDCLLSVYPGLAVFPGIDKPGTFPTLSPIDSYR
jgi:hypothetical protein